MVELVEIPVAVIGSARSGKTSLCSVVCSRPYPKNYVMTTLCQVMCKYIELPTEFTHEEDKVLVELYLHDFPGKELYPQHFKEIITNMRFCIAVFDLTNRDSFKFIDEKLSEFQKIQEENKILGVLVGTKSDLNNFSPIQEDEIQKLKLKWGFDYVECSACEGINLEETFELLARLAFDQHEAFKSEN